MVGGTRSTTTLSQQSVMSLGRRRVSYTVFLFILQWDLRDAIFVLERYQRKGSAILCGYPPVHKDHSYQDTTNMGGLSHAKIAIA